jgi:hypothetical protein
VIVLAWIAVWTSVLVFRATRHPHPDDHSIVVTRS